MQLELLLKECLVEGRFGCRLRATTLSHLVRQGYSRPQLFGIRHTNHARLIERVSRVYCLEFPAGNQCA